MRVLTVNAGSSSVKIRLLGEGDEVLRSRDVDALSPDADGDAIAELGAEADAIGHRVVHGGPRFVEAVRVDGAVLDALRQLVVLAPLHQPPALARIETALRVLAGVPSVACFDTAFHATIPEAARTYALPREWREGMGIRRYGFHGLSHAYVARRAASLAGGAPRPRLVSCHIGAGASLAAVRDGVCVDTTMGYTPLEGLVMATRSGSVDPGAVLWLTLQGQLAPADVLDALEHRSGLTGLCGSSDLREVRRRAAAGDPGAALAVDVYTHRVVQWVAAMTASLGGIDALAFTGGVGEHDAVLRADVAGRLGHLGIALDAEANTGGDGDRDIGAAGALARTIVIEAREDVEIARQVRIALATPPT